MPPGRPHSATPRLPDFRQKRRRAALAAVTLVGAHGEIMPLLRIRGAGIGDEGDEVAHIAGTTHGAINALIGDDAGDEEGYERARCRGQDPSRQRPETVDGYFRRPR